jgi:hypothetical protein
MVVSCAAEDSFHYSFTHIQLLRHLDVPKSLQRVKKSRINLSKGLIFTHQNIETSQCLLKRRRLSSQL